MTLIEIIKLILDIYHLLMEAEEPDICSKAWKHTNASLFICNSLPDLKKCSGCRKKSKTGKAKACVSLFGVQRDRQNIEELCLTYQWDYGEILMSQCQEKYMLKDHVIQAIRNFVRSKYARWLYLSGHSLQDYGFYITQAKDQDECLTLRQIYKFFLEETSTIVGAKLYVVADYCYTARELNRIVRMAPPDRRRKITFYCSSEESGGDNRHFGSSLLFANWRYFLQSKYKLEEQIIRRDFLKRKAMFIDNDTSDGNWSSSESRRLPWYCKKCWRRGTDFNKDTLYCNDCEQKNRQEEF